MGLCEVAVLLVIMFVVKIVASVGNIRKKREGIPLIGYFLYPVKKYMVLPVVLVRELVWHERTVVGDKKSFKKHFFFFMINEINLQTISMFSFQKSTHILYI